MMRRIILRLISYFLKLITAIAQGIACNFRLLLIVACVLISIILICSSLEAKPPVEDLSLWRAYERSLQKAKYVDLTHTITPEIPVWKGFGPSTFSRTINPQTGQPYTYEKDGFEATHYDLSTDQLGTQLDPPAHWDPNYPSIDELPATYTIRMGSQAR
jgi:hypothetical protein